MPIYYITTKLHNAKNISVKNNTFFLKKRIVKVSKNYPVRNSSVR